MPAKLLPTIARDVQERHRLPGAAIGVLHEGRTETAFLGVTSVQNPLDIDHTTRFQIGSVSKTYAVSAILRLVTEQRIGLDDPVRTYLPELRLADESVAASVTVRHLLNHTSGWDGTMTSGDAHPDEPLGHFVDTTLPELAQLGPLGARPEYNNAGVAVAGRVVEKVTGQPYEDALRMLLLEPLGMRRTAFTTDDLMTERVSVGHLADSDGTYRVARPWRWPRAANPEGGLVSTIDDQLRWAGFHLNGGRTPDRTQLIGTAEIAAMRAPTARLVGSAMGDTIGLGWFLRDVGGEQTVSHPGATNGQFAELRLVPSRDLGVVVCASGAPEGEQFVRDAVDTVLAEYAGLRAAPPRTRAYDPSHDGDVGGTYVNSLSRLEVTTVGDRVRIQFSVLPQVAARMGDAAAGVFPASDARFLDGDDGEYLIVAGAFEGSLGAFARSPDGAVEEVAFGGRWHRRDPG